MLLEQITNGYGEIIIEPQDIPVGDSFWDELDGIRKEAFLEKGFNSLLIMVPRDNEEMVEMFLESNIHEMNDLTQDVLDRYASDGKNVDDYRWFAILDGDMCSFEKEVAGCKVIRLATFPTLDSGELSFFEGSHDIPFDIKRIYFISKAPEGTHRGFHAHKKLRQLLFCPFGKIKLILENRHGREEIILTDPSVGVIIEEPTWREMVWLQEDSVLCVAASDYYEVEDYVRDYDEFRRIIEED